MDIRTQQDDYERHVGFALFSDDLKSIAKPLEMGPRDEKVHTVPFMKLKQEEVMNLFQQLWDMGCRPRNEFGTEGHMKSIKEHLADMRTIAFKRLGIGNG